MLDLAEARSSGRCEMAATSARISHDAPHLWPFMMFFFIYLVAIVSGQSPPKSAGPDPVENFCARWWSQSIVKNDVLFVDSGIQKFNESGDIYFGISNYMLTIPLNETWDWKLKDNESQHITIDTTRKNDTNPDTGTPIPSLFRGYMFHGPDNSSAVYRFAGTNYMYNESFEGYVGPESSSYPLWTFNFNSSGSSWDQYNIAQPWLPNHGAGIDAIDHGVGFYLNGQIDMGTSAKTLGALKDITQSLYMPVEGMLIIDLVNFSSKNISSSDLRGGAPRVGGTMEYIASVGDSGILVALGGQIQPAREGGQKANRSEGELIDFTSVDIFDIDSFFQDESSNGTWYHQNTTGEIPAPRIDFCTVSISAPDNSSHHIYLYGGMDPISNSFYDDVVILSLPSFAWTTVWPQGESPRWGHNCHIAGKRQMITVGGNVSNAQCDWEKKGVAVLELSTIDWGSVFRTNTSDYQVPKNVLAATNGTIDGNATVGEPELGWTDDGLKNVFWKSRWEVPSTWSASPTKQRTNKGAIAGGVVGGVAGVALIAGALFLWYRKRVRARSPSELHSEDVRHGELPSDKKKYELQGVNENDPAELAAPEAAELNAPREFVEADPSTTTPAAAELPGTNVAPGGVSGVPVVRTPGDDLPEPPTYTPGLRRRSSTRSRRRSRSKERSNEIGEEEQADTEEEFFQNPTEGISKAAEDKKQSQEHFVTSAEEKPEKQEEKLKDKLEGSR